MKYFEMFAGVGGFTLGIERAYADISEAPGKEPGRDARHRAGDRNEKLVGKQPACIGLSETDKYASAVLAYQFPNVKNYGDCQEIDWPGVPDFDLLVGGSPCQDFSVAGKRAGLTGDRSGLFREFLRSLKEKEPRFFIWENVKGVMSSRGGWDFANIQAALAEAGYSLWWQVLNAKDFGVPQNRERVFVVGTRGGGGREIFFEPGADQKSSQWLNDVPNIEKVGQDMRIFAGDGVSPALQSGGNHGSIAVRRNHGKVESIGDRALNLDANYRWQNKRTGIVHDNQSAPSLRASGGTDIRKRPCVAVQDVLRSNKRQNGKGIKEDESAYTCTSQGEQGVALNDCRIRRLTPTECERLMSWPSVLEITAPTHDDIKRAIRSKVEETRTESQESGLLRDLWEFGKEDGQTSTRHNEQARGISGGVSLLSLEHSQEAAKDELCNLRICLSTEAAMSFKTLFGPEMFGRIKSPFGEQAMARVTGWTDLGIIKGEEIEISDTQRYKMCGNGVVSEVVKHIMRELIIPDSE